MTPEGPSDQPPRAFVHIGAPKTGSTFIQQVLWANKDSLDAVGIHTPGAGQWQHYLAGQDLRDVPFNPDDPGEDWTCAWDRLAELARESPAPTVIITDERLSALSDVQAQRVVTGLTPREVHVVYSTRDLPGLLPSEWQEYLKHGSVQTFGEWADQVLVEEDGPGRWFWRVHDMESVVSRWATAVPRDRIHVITMPSPQAPRDEMWRRFAHVIGCDPHVVPERETTANPSLGLVSAEVLRRVNEALSPDLPKWHRAGVVRDILANRVLNPLGPRTRPRIPAHLTDLIRRRTDHVQSRLADLGCDIVGDVADLDAVLTDVGVADPSDAEVAAVATAALAGLMDPIGALRDELRDERVGRALSEARMKEEHAKDLINALSAQEAEFWRQHPLARSLQVAKERVVQVESSSRAVATAMAAYRSLRGLRPPEPPTSEAPQAK